ncbi:MAG: hypothetical protein M1830_000468, partial [Pleopsidium flavum]
MDIRAYATGNTSPADGPANLRQKLAELHNAPPTRQKRKRQAKTTLDEAVSEDAKLQRVLVRKEHIVELIKENPSMKDYNIDSLLKNFSKGIFNPSHFFYVWYYMEGYVDYERSSPLRQYYIKSIYDNIACETNLYMEAVEAAGGVSADARQKLLAYYDLPPTMPDYKQVDKSDFRRLWSGRERRGSLDLRNVYGADYKMPGILHFGTCPIAWCKKLSFDNR